MRTTIVSIFLFFFSYVTSQEDMASIPKSDTIIPLRAKHTIALKANVNPFVSLLENKNEGELYKHYIDVGLSLDYIYSLSNKFGIGIEYGFEFSKINIENPNFGKSLITQDHLNMDHQGMNIIVQNITPKIEWKKNNSKRPFGLVHQFGIGLSIVNVKKKDYDYNLNTPDPTDEFYLAQIFHEDPTDAEENYDVNQLYDYNNKNYLGLTTMYAIAYRGALSENLLWSIGIRGQVNFNKSLFEKNIGYYTEAEDTMFWISRREMSHGIAESRLVSLFHIQFGLIYKIY